MVPLSVSGSLMQLLTRDDMGRETGDLTVIQIGNPSERVRCKLAVNHHQIELVVAP